MLTGIILFFILFPLFILFFFIILFPVRFRLFLSIAHYTYTLYSSNYNILNLNFYYFTRPVSFICVILLYFDLLFSSWSHCCSNLVFLHQVAKLGVMFPVYCTIYMLAPNSEYGRFMKKPFVKFICHSSSYMLFLSTYNKI